MNNIVSTVAQLAGIPTEAEELDTLYRCAGDVQYTDRRGVVWRWGAGCYARIPPREAERILAELPGRIERVSG